jgi:uncharacterized protein (DUF1778 family)
MLYQHSLERQSFMGRSRRTQIKPDPKPLIIHLDADSREAIADAARLRGKSMSAYVRETAVAQAQRDVQTEGEQIIRMTPDEQLRFWKALSGPVNLTAKQRQLGAMMRGET